MNRLLYFAAGMIIGKALTKKAEKTDSNKLPQLIDISEEIKDNLWKQANDNLPALPAELLQNPTLIDDSVIAADWQNVFKEI